MVSTGASSDSAASYTATTPPPPTAAKDVGLDLHQPTSATGRPKSSSRPPVSPLHKPIAQSCPADKMSLPAAPRSPRTGHADTATTGDACRPTRRNGVRGVVWRPTRTEPSSEPNTSLFTYARDAAPHVTVDAVLCPAADDMAATCAVSRDEGKSAQSARRPSVEQVSRLGPPYSDTYTGCVCTLGGDWRTGRTPRRTSHSTTAPE
mmetsp:Transcript_2135/g.6766  ORF Transcript_2135/g.6766 Transcript_2135/m.6766 type:complete len:206 (-) Transcript_2135:71-688(-)